MGEYLEDPETLSSAAVQIRKLLLFTQPAVLLPFRSDLGTYDGSILEENIAPSQNRFTSSPISGKFIFIGKVTVLW
jgi:hypothetical protein